MARFTIMEITGGSASPYSESEDRQPVASFEADDDADIDNELSSYGLWLSDDSPRREDCGIFRALESEDGRYYTLLRHHG